jgi:hypothetical protein
MSEALPVASGLLIGLAVLRISNLRVRTIVLVALSLFVGVMASYISGELFVSWDFLFVDIPLVFLSAVVATLGLAWWKRRQLRPR